MASSDRATSRCGQISQSFVSFAALIGFSIIGALMCGIAGMQMVGHTNVPAGALTILRRGILHRGPDAQDQFVTENTALVVTRLAIVDLAHGDQPLFSPDRSAIVVNGEIYNSPELRSLFPDYPFKTKSDCEVILSLYGAYGPSFADHLRGMYAIALFDAQTRELILSRDPFGIKPLYFVEDKDCFAFASEIAPLIDAALAPIRLDETARTELLQLKYSFGSKTIFPNVQRVEPGETLIIRDGKIRARFSTPTWPRHPQFRGAAKDIHRRALSSDQLGTEFEKVIFDSVKMHLRADAPSRLLYSGGIDSTILMLAAREVSNVQVPALTIGYEGEEDEDESWDALKLADEAGVACERIEMRCDDFWNLAPRIAAAVDDPMADPAVLPLYMLGAAVAKQGAKVAICGEGADEIFGGYRRYQRALLPGFLRRQSGRRGVFSKTTIATGDVWMEAPDDLEQMQSQLWPSRPQILQAVDVLERLPNCLLIKLDRALMAHGVEGRTPFLDLEVLRFASELPEKSLVSLRMGKRILRDWVHKAFPQAAPYARKKGFNVPLGKWMHARRSELGAMVARQKGVMQIADPVFVQQIFDECRSNEQPAWSLLFYALWHSHHVLRIDRNQDIVSVLSEAARLR
ncbi:MAG: asparagine synthase (glutamine-hydrolyzing) [Proteobacteria bacterium]|nr:asparagine synthase (glutamine-hydrolyzing) [Pseudomonadota bacterium]